MLFGYQDDLEVIKNDINSLVKGEADVERAMHKEEKKKYSKALFLIHQCVDTDNFKKVGDCESSKLAWEILKKMYAGAEKMKVYKRIKDNLSLFKWRRRRPSTILRRELLGW